MPHLSDGKNSLPSKTERPIGSGSVSLKLIHYQYQRLPIAAPRERHSTPPVILRACDFLRLYHAASLDDTLSFCHSEAERSDAEEPMYFASAALPFPKQNTWVLRSRYRA